MDAHLIRTPDFVRDGIGALILDRGHRMLIIPLGRAAVL